VVVTKRIYEANVLFAVALNSAKAIHATSRAGGQLPALVSLVFSAVSVEAFHNEAAEMALSYSDMQSEPEAVSVFAQCMMEAEKSRATLESKLALANWVLVGKKLDTGAQSYQDFGVNRATQE
jgi:predicted outer membrane protein